MISLALSLAIGRLLGKEVFGAYETVFFLLTIFQILCSAGLKPYITREVAKNSQQASRYLWNGLIVILPFSLISLFFLLSSALALNYEASIQTAIFILAISLIASGISDTLEGVLEGMQRIQTIAAVWITEQFVRVVISLVAIYLGHGLHALCLIYAASRFLNSSLLLINLRKRLQDRRAKFDRKLAREMLSSIRVFGPIFLSVALYWRIDSIMMSKMLGFEEVGVYNAAFRLLRFFIIFVQSFITVFYPVISNYFAVDTTKFEFICKKSIFYLFVLLLPMAATFSIFADELITLLWGAAYRESILVLQILIWCILPYMLSKVFAHALLASNLQRYDLMINLMGTAIKIGLLFFFIEQYGYIGAAIANVVAVAIYVLLQIPFIFKNLFRISLESTLRVGAKVGLASAGLLLVAHLMGGFNFILTAIIANIAYAMILWANKIFSSADYELFRQFLKVRYNQ